MDREVLARPQLQYENDLLDIYTSTIAILLRGIAAFTRAQFKRNLSWIGPMIGEMTLVSNITVRTCVKEVYDSHYLPILLEQATTKS